MYILNSWNPIVVEQELSTSPHHSIGCCHILYSADTKPQKLLKTRHTYAKEIELTGLYKNSSGCTALTQSPSLSCHVESLSRRLASLGHMHIIIELSM